MARLAAYAMSRRVSIILLGRVGTPEDVFKMVRFLLCDAEFITGQNFFVNGGQVMV